MQGLSPRFSSSGDLIADRRFEWARDCEAKGDAVAAADLMQQALEIAPRFAAGWYALGGLREKLGDPDGAIDAYRKARNLDPEDAHGAVLNLMRLKAERTDEMPPAYVRELFDQYAPSFDKALQEGLQYRAPQFLLDAVAHVCRAQGRSLHFGSMLDLGCGTGLAGEAFKPHVDRLVGVDLSPAMIAEAKRKAVYDRLEDDDMVRFLAVEHENNKAYGLIVAADVFVYAADLAPVIAKAADILEPQGLLAFTVEAHDGEGAILGEKLRYAHNERYVRAVLEANGFDVLDLADASTRTENGVPVPGLIVVASTSPRSRI